MQVLASLEIAFRCGLSSLLMQNRDSFVNMCNRFAVDRCCVSAAATDATIAHVVSVSVSA